MKNIYFVQANRIYGGTDGKRGSTYIPYATGCIAAYAWADERVAQNYHLGRFIYARENISEAIDSLDNPFMVAFSCSVWNAEYNKVFAKKLKEKYPDCLVLFGGHNVPPGNKYLEELPYVDLLIHNGGEEPFLAILLSLLDSSPLDEIPNISFRNASENITTRDVMQTATEYPSPYLNGIFDEILKDDIDFSVIIETNRGCPNSCAFCDWGYLKSKVRLFPMEKVRAELDWISERGIDYVFCCDGNFGLFDRDEEIADYIIDLKKRTGHPQNFRVCFTKNRCDFVRKIGVKFFESRLDKAQTLSFQSMSPEVLENIGRKNISNDHFCNLMALYNEINISTFSELIMALPGETYESFCDGLCKLIEYGQHKSVEVYPCELLPNSKMGSPEYMEKFSIKTVKSPFLQIHCDNDLYADDIPEYSNFVIETSTLSKEDWVKCSVFSNFVQALHHRGFLRAAAIYVRKENNVSYKDFYLSLLKFMEERPDSVGGRALKNIAKLSEGVANGTQAWVAECEGFGKITWNFNEIFYLDCFKEFDKFYEELEEFLKKFDIDEDVFKALIKYQKDIIKRVGEPVSEICSEYDFFTYYQNIYLNRYTRLKKKNTRILINDTNPIYTNEEYAREIVWYGKNRTANIYTSSMYNPELA